jgi:hypothetical protein
MSRWLRTLIACLLSAAPIQRAGAAAPQVGIEPSDGTGSRFKIVISGRISVATLFAFARALADPRIARTPAPSVELNSPGGSIPAAMAIGGFVRAGGLRTAVARRRTCDSACALILVAGIEWSAGVGSVRIHRPRYEPDQAGEDADARARQAYKDVLANMRDYLERMGPGDRLLDAMLAVPSGRLRALSHRELRAFRLASSRRAPTRVAAARTARLVPSAGRLIAPAGMRKQAKRTRGKPSTPRQRLLQAIISAGPPPGLWRASAHRRLSRSARQSVSRKAAHHGSRQKTLSVRRRGRAPPLA